jgi:transporter family-2 protein
VRHRLDNLLVVLVVAAGMLLGLQARVNGELGARLHSSIAAAAASFTVGLVLLLVVVTVRDRRGIRRLLAADVRWWWWLGGLAGAAVVASTAEGVPEIGVALVSVCIVAGTAVGALLVDAAGLGPGGRRAVTAMRLGGAALAVAAVALGAAGDRNAALRPALFALLFVTGAASAWQQAANGQIRRVADSSAVGALVSFASGSIALIAVAAVRGDLAGRNWPGIWWLYTGGLVGGVYITLAAAKVARLGVLRLALATVAGQLAGGVLLDVVWPVPGAHLRVTTVVGAALTLVAVAVVARVRRTTVPA